MPTEETIKEIVSAYEVVVKGIDSQAQESTSRAYGGIIRAGKGKLVESIAQNITEIGWNLLGGSPDRLSFLHTTFKFPIKKEYVNKIANPVIKKYITDNIDSYYYKFKPDVQICIDKKLVMGIECKAYTENAMFKRILVDFTLLKLKYPRLGCVLVQLESQLGGDYSALKDVTLGSPSTNTLLSYFDIDLNIITLLKGERKVDEPIHKAQYYKPLMEDSLFKAANCIKDLLKEYK